MTAKPYSIIVTLANGTRRDVSVHAELAEAAHIAFQLAEDLSEDISPYDAREVAICRGDKLDLSIAVAPGIPL